MIAARDLPDTDNTFFNISRGDWTDPFVSIFLDGVITSLLIGSHCRSSPGPAAEDLLPGEQPGPGVGRGLHHPSLPLGKLDQGETTSSKSFTPDPTPTHPISVPARFSVSAPPLLLLQVKVMDREHVGAEVVGVVIIHPGE